MKLISMTTKDIILVNPSEQRIKENINLMELHGWRLLKRETTQDLKSEKKVIVLTFWI